MKAMQHPAPGTCEREAQKARLVDLWERTGDRALQRLAEGLPPIEGAVIATEQDRVDWLSTSLMETYKNTGEPAVFAFLHDLNRASFLLAIQGTLRRTHRNVDCQDVLQEVFLNIYRYPHRFLADRCDAFRNWGHRIVRNTLLKFLKHESRASQVMQLDDEVQQPEDPRARSPERAASEAESASLVNHAYVLYLNLYLLHFQRLSAKEQRALQMVEVEGVSYKDAAAALAIRLENLKMVIFRGRRKIFRGMERSLDRIGTPAAPVASSRSTRPVRDVDSNRQHASQQDSNQQDSGPVGASSRPEDRTGFVFGGRGSDRCGDPMASDAPMAFSPSKASEHAVLEPAPPLILRTTQDDPTPTIESR
jgi:RNA polymerase sigma factor (sigma-70 family)